MSANDVASAPDADKFPILLTKADTKDKTYIVTGSNQGLGLEAARHLVSLGAAKVILTARNLDGGKEAVRDIETATGIKGVAEVWYLDLTIYDSVKKFAKKANLLERLDGVIQNAGIGLDTWSIAEGHETNVTVNTYSILLLDILLLPKLKETGKKFGSLPHLVNVGTSFSFLNEKDLKQLHESGMKGLDVEANAVMADRYAISKLVTKYAIYQLAEQLGTSTSTTVVLNICCPGLVKSRFIRHRQPDVLEYLTKYYEQFGREVEPASRAYLQAINAGRESHGKFLRDCEIKQDEVPSWLIDDGGKKLGRQLWAEIVVELEKVAPGAVANVLSTN